MEYIDALLKEEVVGIEKYRRDIEYERDEEKKWSIIGCAILILVGVFFGAIIFLTSEFFGRKFLDDYLEWEEALVKKKEE